MNDFKETMNTVDQLVSEYVDRLAGDRDPRREELLAEAPESLRGDLARCLDMVDATRGTRDGTAELSAETSVLGDFRLREELGRGGMAVVYEAQQESLQRTVALKVLRQHLSLDERQIARFTREAQAAARLSHPNIVAIHGVGEDRGHHYIAFEKIDGPTLGGVITRLAALGRPPTEEDLAEATGCKELAEEGSYFAACTHLIAGVFAGVDAAHRAGIIHRDLKPSNVLIDRLGKPLVADFGLAKGADDLGLSVTGESLGTPHYMSPEQAIAAAPNSVDATTDVYSLGVTLYELLTLRRPFAAATFGELVQQIIHELPPPLSAGNTPLPRALEDVVLKAMAKDPEKRYATVADFRADVERAVRGDRVVAESGTGLVAMIQGAMGAELTKSPYEYKSRRTIFGLPWVHIVLRKKNPETGKPRWAKGVIAIGNRALGVYAAGGVAIGVMAMGILGVGVIALGAAAIGYQVGGVLACGYIASGMFVFAVYGHALMEGTAIHLLGPGVQDPAAVEQFNASGAGENSFDASSLFFGGAFMSATLFYAQFKGLATTAGARRLVAFAFFGMLPLLYALPWLLELAGHPVSFIVALGMFALSTLAVCAVVHPRLTKRPV